MMESVGEYNLGGILRKEPAVVAAVAEAVFSLLVLMGVIDVSATVVAGVGGVTAMVLALFYVRPNVNTNLTLEREKNRAYLEGVDKGAERRGYH